MITNNMKGSTNYKRYPKIKYSHNHRPLISPEFAVPVNRRFIMKLSNQYQVNNFWFNQLIFFKKKKNKKPTCTPFKLQRTDTAREQLYLGPLFDILTMTPVWGFFLSAIGIALESYII